MASEQPMSQVADGSLPDANGWYKSNIVIENNEVENEAEEEDPKEYPYMKAAEDGFQKAAKDWPEGKVFRMSYGGAETIQEALHIGYGHEQEDKGFMSLVQIDLYINLPQPEQAYKEFSEYTLEDDKKKEIPNAKWTEWPRGFPNKNEYEQISHCGANADFTVVAWIQNKTMVQLSKIRPSEAMLAMFPAEDRDKIVSPDLKEYADGVWQVVNGMGL